MPKATGMTCDADNDGVVNGIDQCPNTPTRATLNVLGCRDADGEGFSSDLPITSPFYDPANNDGCKSNPSSSACVVSAKGNLIPNFTFGDATYVVGDERYIIVNINNGGTDTSNGVEFFVPNSAGFTFKFDHMLANVMVNGTSEAVNNTSWTTTNTSTGNMLTSSVSISPNSRLRAAFKVTTNVAGTEANLTVNLNPAVGSNSQPFNNTALLIQTIQN